MAEKEYIEREAAIADLELYETQVVKNEYALAIAGCRSHIRKLPAADVRPVVLCRDCKWCHAGYCEKYDDLIPFGCANKPWEDWFCADGKKREES